MSTETHPAGRGAVGPLARLVAHLRVPVHRNGYALVLSSTATSVLGALYWFLAARRYDAAALGLGAAMISATGLLANVATIGLKNGLVHFVPTAGRSTRTLVLRAYVAAGAVAAVLGAAFLAGLQWWAPDLAFLRQNSLTTAFFVACVVAWVIFILQDSVLVGLGKATWVPVENVAFSVAKIVLLFVIAALTLRWGVFLSWTAPTFVAVVVVNRMVLRVLARNDVVAAVGATADGRAPTLGEIARFSGADHVASLLWFATLEALPLLVLRQEGATANAYFSLALQVGYGLYLLSSSVGTALVAEAAHDPARLPDLAHKVARQTLGMVLPCVAAVVLGAPQLLRFFGPDYAREGTAVLRLLAVSALPFAAISLALSLARAERRMKLVVGIHLTLLVGVASLALALLPRMGITGIGWAVLVTQLAVAAVLALTELRGVLLALVAGSVLTRVSAVRHGARKGIARFRLPALVHRLPAASTARRLRDGTVLSAQHGVVVARYPVPVLGRWSGDEVVLKLATDLAARHGLGRHADTARAVHADPRLTAFAPLVPTVRDSGTFRGGRFVLEDAATGDGGEEVLGDPARRRAAILAAAESAGRLHAATARSITVGAKQLEGWVDEPLRLAVQASRSPLAELAAAALRRELHAALEGRTVTVSRVHGDFAPGNVLFRKGSTDVAAIIDWEASADDGLPELDLATFLLAARRHAAGAELGTLVHQLAAGTEEWSTFERGVVQASAGRNVLPTRVVVLLAWLAHLSVTLGRSARYRRHLWWVGRNVDAVLEGVVSAPNGAAGAVDPGSPTASRLGGRPISRLHALARLGLPPGWARTALAISLFTALWMYAVSHVDPRRMTDTGLLSVLPPEAYVALALLTISFVRELLRGRSSARVSEWRLGAHVIAFIVAVHATPPIVYGTLRYSWAWKHIGIVNYIERNGRVNPGIDVLDVYHNWPGFFSSSAALAELLHLKSVAGIAMWAPLLFNLLSLAALVLLLPAFTQDRRVVWLGCWLFFVTNWVGQDYFAPQALTYFLHLVVLGLVLHRFRTGAVDADERRARIATGIVVLLLVAAIVSSHQLTPLLLLAELFLLTLFRQIRAWGLVIATAVMEALWLGGPAWTFVSKNLRSTLESFGSPTSNAGETLAKSANVSEGQRIVSMMGRGVVVVIGILAVLGVITRLRARKLDRAAVILLLAPGLSVFGNSFGGEILFRAYLFAVPMLALFAAWFLLSVPGEMLRRLVAAGTSALLITGFLYAYFGKDTQYHFSKQEVAAVEYLSRNAVDRTLLVEGSTNYPKQFENYERFVYVPIVNEPRETVDRIIDDPVATLESWLDNPEYQRAYVLITRSQKAAVDELGEMPKGSLDDIERALRQSPKFRVAVWNEDAVVFELAEQATAAEAARTKGARA